MKPIETKNTNHKQNDLPMTLIEFQPQNLKGNETCWKINLLERIRLLFTGKLYVFMETHNPPKLLVDTYSCLTKKAKQQEKSLISNIE